MVITSPVSASEKIHLGLSGVVLPQPKYKFSAEMQKLSRLSIYSTFFNSIEINETFYKIPQAKTLEKWSGSVPDNFKFTFKLHQDFTHCKGLYYPADGLAGFIQTISVVGKKSGSVLLQFPPSLKANNIDQLEELLKDLANADVKKLWTFAAEFRDDGWYNDDTFDLLKRYNISLVIQDIPRSSSPFITTSKENVYVRFHGPAGTYRGSYANEFLEEYAEYILEWVKEGRTVNVYFNNTAGDAFNNSRSLQRYLAQAIEK